MIIVWTQASSIIVKQGWLILHCVAPKLTYGQMCELPVLLHASIGYHLIASLYITKADCFV